MEENRQIMRALATAMNRIDQMYCDDVTRIGVKASELWLLYALDDGAPHSQKQIWSSHPRVCNQGRCYGREF